MSPLVAAVIGILCFCGHGLAQKYNYKEVLGKSILFFEAQRSGKLTDKRISWRGDSAMGDGRDRGRDLTGGWYDAGDHVKFGFPMAGTATILAWGLLEFRDGYAKAGELDNALRTLRWVLDYFVKCHNWKNEFFGQVGDGNADHAFWGRPEDMTMNRPAWSVTASRPGSDLVAETAAALAAGSMVFRDQDAKYGGHLKWHAQELFEFAKNHRGLYHDGIHNARDFYRSSGDRDEIAFAAAWLLRATDDQQYRAIVDQHYDGGQPWSYSWDAKDFGVQLLMAITTNDQKYKNDITKSINHWLPGGGMRYTPKGLVFRDKWGSLRYAANMCALAMIAAKHGIRTTEYQNWAEKQIGYMLGDTGRSYVVGYGNNPPTQPHHRAASCPGSGCSWNDFNRNAPNPHVLHGALVGGPDENDWYQDRRNDYRANEVACDYNGGFQTALAGLVSVRQ